MEVEVDTWLGHVRVLNVHTGLAVGKIAAPALARSQAAGSVIQGIGYALYEARETDASSGHVLTTGMEDYRIPGIADTPDDRRAFRRGRVRSCDGRQRRHRRSRDRSDLAGDRQRHLQRDRHPADGDPDQARPHYRSPQREERSMSISHHAIRAGIPRRRHRSLRTPPQRRVERPLVDLVRRAMTASSGARTAPPPSAPSPPSPTIAADKRITARLSRRCRHRAGPRHAADPSSRDARRQPRPALALLVFSQSAYRLPEEGRHDCPARVGQSSLQRRLRSRPLRRAASLHDGGRAARL